MQPTADPPDAQVVGSPPPAGAPCTPDHRRLLRIGLAATGAVALVVAVVLVLTNDDDDGSSTGVSPVTDTADSTGTSQAPTTSATTNATVAATEPPSSSGSTAVFTAPGTVFALSHDGTRLATGSIDGPTTTVWDLRSGDQLFTFDDWAFSLTFTPDDRLLVSTSTWDLEHGYNGSSRSFRVADGQQVAEFPESYSLSGDGKYLVGKAAGVLEFRDVNTGALASTFSLSADAMSGEAGPDGRHLLLRGWVVDVGDVVSGQVLYRLSAPEGCADGGDRFSPDGRRIMMTVECGGMVLSTMVVDTDTGGVVLDLNDAAPVALSADGSQILTAYTSADPGGTLRVWDTATGQLLHTLALPTSTFDDIPGGTSPDFTLTAGTPGEFSNDGRRIVTTMYADSSNGPVPVTFVWDVATETLLFHSWRLAQVDGLSADGSTVVGIRSDWPTSTIEVYRF